MVGWLTFPLAYRLLPSLPDRGYAFSRSLGLLFSGYIFWILTTLGFLNNDPGGVLLAFGAVGSISIISLLGPRYHEIKGWLRNHIGIITFVEILFLGAFAIWALVRSYNPDIVATEKPMELAFLNAVLRAQSFPPHDPWLSGYAISYYYFGYVLVGMLAQLTFSQAGIAFNLGISLIFALSAVGAYGLVYNLLSLLNDKGKQTKHQVPNSGSGEPEFKVPDELRVRKATNLNLYGLSLFGPLFLLIISNLVGLLEVLHARGFFWRLTEMGEWTSSFWSWLDMKELSQPPGEPFSWIPTRYLWWWRASRVVSDYNMTGTFKEVIDEFPFFSYLLADLHPHILAMPFVLLAIALALNLFFGGMQGSFRWLWFYLQVNSRGFWLAALLLGSLAFFNTWDFPIYVALVASVYGISRITSRVEEESNCSWDDPSNLEHNKNSFVLLVNFLKDSLLIGFALGVSGVVLYLPFYLTFSSQAGGVLPNLINPTRGAHFWVMFGSLLIPLFAYQIYLWIKIRNSKQIFIGTLMSSLIIVGLWGISLLLGRFISNLPFLGELYLASIGAVGQRGELFSEAIYRRLMQPGGWITILIIMGVSFGLGLIYTRILKNEQECRLDEIAQPIVNLECSIKSRSHLFVVLLIFFATFVALIPEFFFLRDHFGTRMNTVFKFYYQAWLMWAIAAAFGLSFILISLRGLYRLIISIALLLVIGAGLVYAPLSLWTKTNGFSAAHGLTLDGTEYLARQAPDEVEAIRWLQEAPLGVLVEAVGSSYSIYGRVAAHSGQPSILNWPFHQVQWRGSSEILGSRQGDVERIYTSNNWIEVESILHQYDVSYVYVGTLERNAYRVNEGKFMRFLPPVFRNDSVTIYGVQRKLD
jgi:YYY domain-containing protein